MWKKVGCAVQGRNHITNNIPCQDKTLCQSANGVEIIALADGAGSAKFSHFGAEAALRKTAAILSENFDSLFNSSPETFRKTILTGIQEELIKLESKYNCLLKDLSSTLLVVAIKNQQYLMAHLGDGVIGYIKNGHVAVASEPQNGEFANTTFFTTSKQAFQLMTTMRGQLNDITGFVLMSDGSENAFYNKRQHTLAPAVNDLFGYNTVYPSRIFLKQLEDDFKNIIRKMTTDDCSISIISRCNAQTLANSLAKIPLTEKYALFGIKRAYNPSDRKKVQRVEKVLCDLTDKSLAPKVEAKSLHIKKRYMQRELERLVKINLLQKNKGLYSIAE